MQVTNAEAYERDCLAEVKRFLDSYEASLRGWHKAIRDVRLEGEAPETKLVVTYHDAKARQDHTQEFELWGESFEASDGSRDRPGTVATIVAANIVVP